jgi:glycosyltransferase involved in cell wall biosynthesis
MKPEFLDLPAHPGAPPADPGRQLAATGTRQERVTIVIPAYNEEVAIEGVVTQLARHYPEFEILVVDDGSQDKTGEIAGGLPCRTVRHEVNRGYGATWKTGCREAAGDIIMFVDGDGQFDDDDVRRAIDTLVESKADMVSGARQRASHTPILRRPGKFLLAQLAAILVGQKIPDLNCGLRVVRRDMLIRYLHLLPDGFSASTTSLLLFLKRRYKVVFFPIVTKKRLGKSSVKALRDGFGTIMLMVSLIALFNPLRIFLPVSALLFVTSFVYSAYEAFAKGLGVPVLGAVLFIGGMLSFLMGVMCDQISAIRLERFEGFVTPATRPLFTAVGSQNKHGERGF